MERPTKITVKFLATAATIAPTPNMANEEKITGFLPKIVLKFPRTGWKTVLVSKNEVPAQNASSAVPWRSRAMIGRATDREVASNAAINVIIDKLLNATINLHPGLKAAVEPAEEICDAGRDAAGESDKDSNFSSLSGCASSGLACVVIMKGRTTEWARYLERGMRYKFYCDDGTTSEDTNYLYFWEFGSTCQRWDSQISELHRAIEKNG
jgi:hypothetical protein